MAYNKTIWQTGEIITASKLNNIENGILLTEEEINNATNSFTGQLNRVADSKLN